MKPATMDIYRDAAGQWRWRLCSANNRIIADSAEGYTRRRSVRRAAEAVQAAFRGRVLLWEDAA